MDEESLAAKLVKHGASPDAINNITGDCSFSLLLVLLLILKMIHTITVGSRTKLFTALYFHVLLFDR